MTLAHTNAFELRHPRPYQVGAFDLVVRDSGRRGGSPRRSFTFASAAAKHSRARNMKSKRVFSMLAYNEPISAVMIPGNLLANPCKSEFQYYGTYSF